MLQFLRLVSWILPPLKAARVWDSKRRVSSVYGWTSIPPPFRSLVLFWQTKWSLFCRCWPGFRSSHCIVCTGAFHNKPLCTQRISSFSRAFRTCLVLTLSGFEVVGQHSRKKCVSGPSLRYYGTSQKSSIVLPPVASNAVRLHSLAEIDVVCVPISAYNSNQGYKSGHFYI